MNDSWMDIICTKKKIYIYVIAMAPWPGKTSGRILTTMGTVFLKDGA